MPIDIYESDPRYEHDGAGRRAPPRCYMRPATSEAVGASRSNAEATAQTFALGLLLSIISCTAVFLLVQSGWNF